MTDGTSLDLGELVALEDALSSLIQNTASGGLDNSGVQFKINIEKQWAGTVGLRCNQVQVSALPRYLGTVIYSLVAARRIAFWEHTSIAPCYRQQRENGRKYPVVGKKTLYFTLRPSDALYQVLRKKWPEGNFIALSKLVTKLKELQEEGI